MTEPKTFDFTVDDAGVATVTLDDPDTLNALTFESYRELGQVFRQIDGEAGVRALVITGEGRAFSSGGNVQTIIGALVNASLHELQQFNALTGEAVLALRALRKPVVAAINGVAVGGGAALALAADIRLCAKGARIGFVFPRVGLSAGDMGVTWLLPRVIGLGRAAELLLTGDLVDSDAALGMGLVNRVVSADRLLDEAAELAARLAKGPALALAETKRLLDEVAALHLDEAMAREQTAQVRCMQSDEFREAHEAITQKRPPRFVR